MRKEDAHILPGDQVSPLRDLKPHVFASAFYKVIDTKIVRRRSVAHLFMKLEVRHLCKCVEAWWPSEYFAIVTPKTKRGQKVNEYDVAAVMVDQRGKDETSGVGGKGQGMAEPF